jgi:hypothetical protein
VEFSRNRSLRPEPLQHEEDRQMWLKWLPWRYVISQFARRHGFLDPMRLLARMHQFAQPSEVTEPIELLRAGVVFHARGLINSKAIQHNLDWVWPYWVERQFNPLDESFVPRAFSITHVNLTHRNWTAVGQPDCDWLPIVDPRGLVTPLYDGWSLDAWVVPDQGEPLLPSRAADASQRLLLDENLEVETFTRRDGHELHCVVDMIWENDQPCCRLRVAADSDVPGWLVVALRPTNPEGVSFIHEIELDEHESKLRVDREASVQWDRRPDRVCMSKYHRGDVFQDLLNEPPASKVVCDVGLATAAAMYRLDANQQCRVTTRVPLIKTARHEPTTWMNKFATHSKPTEWRHALEGRCLMQTPDERMNFLFDAAVQNLVLHSPGEVYPGPYTYKRFWFRDAAFILNGLLVAGMLDRVKRVLQNYPARQTALGYFHSQDGEWDSNGEAIWIMDRYRRMSGERLPAELVKAVAKGVRWIKHKRLSDSLDEPHAGLLPAGFSAEHLGPNDYYYWDDFWSTAGLRSAAAILREAGDEPHAADAEREAELLLSAVDRSIEHTAPTRSRRGVAASPYRRMDSGAVGSIVCGYPLELWDAHDQRLLDTVDFLLDNCMVHGGFFQDMIHSGVNPYLTLHLAQVLLRAGDSRHFRLVRAVADLASPTGQWPEAIHPRTHGGCMGDGQHIWAAAEWVLMLRNCFVREENDRLILCSGLPEDWLRGETTMKLGPTPTPFGPITVEVEPQPDQIHVRWQADWRGPPPKVELRLAGHEPLTLDGDDFSATISATTANPR